MADNGWDYGPGNYQDEGVQYDWEEEMQPSGWDYGPGNYQDKGVDYSWENPPETYDPSGWDYGPGNFQDQDVNYDWENQMQPSGWDFGPGNFQDPGVDLPWEKNYNLKEPGWGDMWDKGTNALSKLFGTSNGVGGVAASTPFLKTLIGLMAAREEKKGNQQMASQYPQITNQMRAQTSPYDNPGAVDPNSMRGKAQAEALAAQARMNAFRDNPLSDAGYRNMSTFDAQRVARLAAANKQLTDPLSGDVIGGGSRMNSGATSIASKSYDTMRQLAILKQMQADRDALMHQSGAGQYMGMGGLEQLMAGAKYGAQGNSPYFSALGYGVNANQYANNPDLQAMMAEWKAQQGNV